MFAELQSPIPISYNPQSLIEPQSANPQLATNRGGWRPQAEPVGARAHRAAGGSTGAQGGLRAHCTWVGRAREPAAAQEEPEGSGAGRRSPRGAAQQEEPAAELSEERRHAAMAHGEPEARAKERGAPWWDWSKKNPLT